MILFAKDVIFKNILCLKGAGYHFYFVFGLSSIPFSKQKEFIGNDGMLFGVVCHSCRVNLNVEIRRYVFLSFLTGKCL